MHASGDSVICPLAALSHILRAQAEIGDSGEYLCGDTSSADVATALKATVASAGVPTANYSTHSIRIGGATALLAGEASQLSIKLLGRWVSNCFEQDPVQAAESTRTLSLRMVVDGQQTTHA
ncbi:hypothetical protein ON010_g17197 [Phytophthora cinnamomi]|nr:hypothetical protein ON010_g17197 [Phytophthora cinnamomi]